jgi:hypothetical protein
MYGKHFESTYTGSMYGKGLNVFAVWGWVIAHARNSRVELNPRQVSDTLGGTVAEVEAAIEILTSPDPESRHKEHDGRRMIKEGEFQYFLPSWASYQGIRNADDRRAYNAAKQREYRVRKKEIVVEGTKAGARLAIRKGLAESMVKQDYEALADFQGEMKRDLDVLEKDSVSEWKRKFEASQRAEAQNGEP